MRHFSAPNFWHFFRLPGTATETDTQLMPPTAPQNLANNDSTFRRLRFAWDAPPETVNGYRIRYGLASDTARTTVDVGADVTDYELADDYFRTLSSRPDRNADQSIEVLAFNDGGNSPYASLERGLTGMPSFTVDNSGDDWGSDYLYFELQYNDQADVNEEHIEVHGRLHGETSWGGGARIDSSLISYGSYTGRVTVDIQGLQASTGYDFRWRSVWKHSDGTLLRASSYRERSNFLTVA